MRLSIERLRWGLAAGALLLVVLLAGYIGYGRYKALLAYRRILKRAGITLSRDSKGVTFSQSLQGRKVFTVRAASETQIADRRWALHDAEVLLYTRSQERPDRIYGKEFEYDEKQGIARALGEVHMDMQPPEALKPGHKAPQPSTTAADGEGAEVIHVLTSGLVYLRALGVAATDQQVEFKFQGMECTARGAEFNTGQSTVHLLADVVATGVQNGTPVKVTATRADLDRGDNVASLSHPVVQSHGRTAEAEAATFNLRKDGSVEDVRATGGVVVRSGTQQVRAAQLMATLTKDNVLQTAQLSGGVTAVDTDPRRPAQGGAQQVDATFDARGAPLTATATGGAKLSVMDKAAGPRGLVREVEGQRMVARFAPVPPGGSARSRAVLNEVQVNGAAHARGESFAKDAQDANGKPRMKTTQVRADDLRVVFGPALTGAKGQRPQRLIGTGHTLLVQEMAPRDSQSLDLKRVDLKSSDLKGADVKDAEQQTSAGDTLEMVFAEESSGKADAVKTEGLAVASVVQTGHVSVRARAAAKPGQAEGTLSTATADRAAYDAASQRLRLTGAAHLVQEKASLTAASVVLDQRTQDAEANGNVQATLLGRPVEGKQSEGGAAAVTHVLSDSARFVQATRLAEFRGSDAQPARMWQEASQVQAASLLFDGEHRSFSARPAGTGGMVHAVFAGAARASSGKPSGVAGNVSGNVSGNISGKGAGSNVVRVAGPKMDYSDLQREAVFSGGVQMDGSAGQVNAERAVVFLSDAPKPAAAGLAKSRPKSAAEVGPFSGSLERIVVSGNVMLDQPGRRGNGEQLVYTAATGSYILTGSAGKPPRIVDAQQGSLTGTTLLFGDAGSTIVVAGEQGAKRPSATAPAAKQAPAGRVHTETEIKQ